MKEFIDKLIERLEEKAYNHFDLKLSDAIEIVNHLAEEYINCSTDISTKSSDCSTKVSEMPTGWIPCSERLPEEYGEYLVCNKYGVYGLGFPNKDKYGNIYVETESEYITEVVAWMPLPAPYTEGE